MVTQQEQHMECGCSDGVPGSGDHPLHENTVYAIELNAKVYIKE